MNNPNTILIGFADALSAPEVAYCLTEASFRVAAFIRKKSRKPALSRFKRVNIYEITAPEEDREKSISEIRALYQSLNASMIMPLNDRGVWLCNLLSDDRDIKIAGASGYLAAFSLDKRIQIEAARNAGFRVPHSFLVNNPEDISQITNFPVILKPALAVAEDNGKLVQKEKIGFFTNIHALKKGTASWKGTQPLLAQTVQTGVGGGLFGFATDSDIYCWSAHMRVRMMNPKGSGSSACRSEPVDQYPIQQAKNMLMSSGWKGQFMIELLLDDSGNFWFIELNGRPWGSMALALRMGFSYPLWTAQQVLNPNFIPIAPTTHQPVTCRHVGREIIHVLQVIRGPSSSAIPNWPSVRQTLLNVLRIKKNDRFYNWRSYNKSLFIYDIYNTILSETVLKWLKK